MRALFGELALSIAVGLLAALVFSGFGEWTRYPVFPYSHWTRTYSDGTVVLIGLMVGVICFGALRVWEGKKR